MLFRSDETSRITCLAIHPHSRLLAGFLCYRGAGVELSLIPPKHPRLWPHGLPGDSDSGANGNSMRIDLFSTAGYVQGYHAGPLVGGAGRPGLDHIGAASRGAGSLGGDHTELSPR